MPVIEGMWVVSYVNLGFVHQTSAHRGNVIFLHKMDTTFYVVDIGRRKGSKKSLAFGVSV